MKFYEFVFFFFFEKFISSHFFTLHCLKIWHLFIRYIPGHNIHAVVLFFFFAERPFWRPQTHGTWTIQIWSLTCVKTRKRKPMNRARSFRNVVPATRPNLKSRSKACGREIHTRKYVNKCQQQRKLWRSSLDTR